ncbi:MAG: ABC transporter permease [Acidimicrobiales bacterium]
MAIAEISLAVEPPAPEVDGPVDGLGHTRRRPWRLVGSYLGTLFFLVNVNFWLPRLLPGNPIKILTGGASAGRGGQSVAASTRASLTRYYGLDQSLWAQYRHYLGALARGDLGTSIRYNSPVSHLMWDRGKWTLLLAFAGVAMSCVVSLVAGIHSGWRRGRRVDRGLFVAMSLVSHFPSYVLAFFAVIVFGVKLHWLPIGGAQTPFVNYGVLARVLDITRHLVLPGLTVALSFAFIQYLVMRGGMVSELGSDHLLGGRAMGLSERRLKYRYAARNSLLPVATEIAVDLGVAVSVVSFFIERVFAYPGIGGLMFGSIYILDYPVMQGCFLAVAVFVLSVNLLAELAYPRLDPRVKL